MEGSGEQGLRGLFLLCVCVCVCVCVCGAFLSEQARVCVAGTVKPCDIFQPDVPSLNPLSYRFRVLGSGI